MSFAICPISVVPVRSNSNERSEQVSQLLFGETVEVLEKKGKQWSKIRCTWDNLVGWVSSHQLQAITPSEYETYHKHYAYNLELLHAVLSNNASIPIPLGSKLPNFDGIQLEMGDQRFTFSGQAVFPENLAPKADMVLKIARKLLYAPAQPGGRSPLGIDAAGLVQIVFQIIGIQLDRSPALQVHNGHPIDFVEQAQAGDLAFFENRKGKIDHVGILLPDLSIIHAFGHVRMDKLDHFGIFNEATQQYSHQLRVIKRILPEADPQENDSSSKTTSEASQVELFNKSA
jgi:cell wall-associated NlpC family hydrolase